MKKYVWTLLFLALSTPAMADEKYAKMDADKDGKVSAEEFKALYPTMKDNVFGIIDSDADKSISLKEWKDFQSMHTKGMKAQPDNAVKGMGSDAGDDRSRGMGSSPMRINPPAGDK